MNFDYNEEQQLLADSVRRFLAKDYDFEARRQHRRLRGRLEPHGLGDARRAWA